MDRPHNEQILQSAEQRERGYKNQSAAVAAGDRHDSAEGRRNNESDYV